jgi:FKBP-type peptidyl-prolyl cis-trans isomerase
MKKTFTLIIGSMLSVTTFGQVLNQVDSVSYLIGKSFGGNIAREMPEVNRDLLIQGLLNEINAAESLIMDDGGITISSYFEKKTAQKVAENAKAFEANKAKGVAFLEENKKNPNVKVTASGLQYEVITMGKGPKPTETSNVKVHYHGTTPEGKVFDSSVDRGEPITFALNQVIPGWIEGLQLMPVGSKFMLYIPQELAYGESPQGDIIEPFMPLVFEVELLSIEK